MKPPKRWIPPSDEVMGQIFPRWRKRCICEHCGQPVAPENISTVYDDAIVCKPCAEALSRV